MHTENTTLVTYEIANTWQNHDEFHICNEILSFIDVHVFWPQNA